MLEGTKTQFNPFSYTFADFLTLQTLDKLNVALLWCVNITKSKIKGRKESLFIETAYIRIYKAALCPNYSHRLLVVQRPFLYWKYRHYFS